MYTNNCYIHRKLTELNARIMLEKPDFIAITETCLQTLVNNADLHFDDYVSFRRDRVNRRGGGVIGHISSSLDPSLPADAESTDGLEAIYCDIHQHCLPILVIYRSPSAWLDDDSHLFKALKFVSTQRDDCLIVGDFNCPNVDWDNYIPCSENSFEVALLDTVDDLLLHQHVLSPTRFRTG